MMKVFLMFLASITLWNACDTNKDIQLLRVYDYSDVTLMDLWPNKSAPVDPAYVRNSLIDNWDIYPPNKMQLIVKDAVSRHIFEMEFDPTGSSSNLTSWLTYSRYMIGAFKITSSFDPYISTDILEMRNPIDSSAVFLAHGKYNGTLHSQLICFTTNGSAFPLTSAIDGRQAHDAIFYERNYHDNAGFNEYYINNTVFRTDQQYIRSIAVLNQDNTSVTFRMEFAPWNGQCERGELQDIKDKYSFKSDGNLNSMDVFKARCLRIFFSELVYNVTIYLAQPVDAYLLGYSIMVIGTYDNLPEETTTPTPITTTDDPCECECPNKYEYLTKQNLTYEQLEEALRNETERLKKELSVDKKSLSSTIRTKISAPDDRPSSGVIGWFGGLLIGLQTLFIVSLDVCWCLNKVKLLVTKLFKKDS